MTTTPSLFRASFRAYGIPKAQPRARATMRGGHAGVYDPGTAAEWKSIVVFAARALRPGEFLDGPLSVTIDLFFPRPKRLCRARDPQGRIRHTAKPDRDNCEKAILDALTQDGWFRDDSQVCAGEVRKWYHEIGGRPGVEITIEELQP